MFTLYIVAINEFYYQLKLMYLFLRHVVHFKYFLALKSVLNNYFCLDCIVSIINLLFSTSRYVKSWMAARMRRRGTEMQNVEQRCDKVNR
jgi:hypothetical protein